MFGICRQGGLPFAAIRGDLPDYVSGALLLIAGMASMRRRPAAPMLILIAWAHFTSLSFFLPVVTAPECSRPRLKSRPRLPECLQVPWRYREALENSPGIRPLRRGSPPHPVPPRPFH